MILLGPFRQLRDLDRTSPHFHDQLSDFFRGDEYRGVFPKLQSEDLAWLAEYLDSVLVSISDHASSAFQLSLRELSKIAGVRKMIPRSCTLPGSLLGCAYEGTFNGAKVRIRRVKLHPGGGVQKVEQAFHRVVVMSKYMKHPNIVSLLGVTIDPFEFISEWMPGGNLPGYIANNPDADRVSLLSDVAEGLNYLHSCDMVHGDLKGSNILMDAAGHARITDFGLAVVTQDVASIRSASTERDIGVLWVAPEILEGWGTCSKEADVFSFAGVAIETFTGAVPFSDKPPQATIPAITTDERPPRPTNPALTDGLWALIERCWNKEAHLRPHALRILCHFNGIAPWKRLVDPSLTSDGRISLITDIFSDRNETEAVLHLREDDARLFVEVIDEVLVNLAPWLRRKCLTALCKICSHQAFLPRSVQIPLCYDRMGTPLYRGGFSDVWKGEHKGCKVAVKVLTVYETSNLDLITKMFCKEVITWKALRHQNVLPLLGVTMSSGQFAMVSEWMTNGNINEFVKKHMDINRLELLRGVARGLIYMHGEGIIHGDLKGANILIDQHRHACLADFGLTSIISDPAYSITSIPSLVGGTTRWMSPERLNPIQFGIKDSRPTRESDCYALGMVILEVLSGQIPFTRDCNDFMVMSKVLDDERPGRPQGAEGKWFTEDLWVKLQVCWSRKPDDRPTVEAMLKCLIQASTTWQALPPSMGSDSQMDSDDESYLTVNEEFPLTDFGPNHCENSEKTRAPATDYPPITKADLVKLGVEPRLIPSVVSTAQRAERSSSGEPQLTSTEAETLIEVLDKALSSNTVNTSMKDRRLTILRKVSLTHGILPKSYHLPLSDTIPCSSGGFADVWRGQLDGRQMCVKAFRTHGMSNLDKIKRRFYHEIIGWKYIVHPNLLPFHGISEMFSFCVVNPWLPNGNILEYSRKNKRVNRLRLLAQAARGLEHLHSLGIVHSDVNPGNVLINEDGTARLGDFGVTGLMTDPTIVEPGGIMSEPCIVRYMAPELLNPSQFDLVNSNPTKESDVFSFAMTTYEVLTETLPYANARDGIIIFHVVPGDRSPGPENARWLRNQIWDMIAKCWGEQQELRWDIRSVYNRLSESSVQEIAEGGRGIRHACQPVAHVGEAVPFADIQIAAPVLNVARDPPSSPCRGMPVERFTIFVEGNLDVYPRLNQGGTVLVMEPKAAQVFAFGMFAVEVFTGKISFEQQGDEVVGFHVLRGKKPEMPQNGQEAGVTAEVWNLLESCWQQNPKRRLKMGGVVRGLWEFVGNDDNLIAFPECVQTLLVISS